MGAPIMGDDVNTTAEFAEALRNSRPFRLCLDSDSDQIETLTCNVYEAIGGIRVNQKPALALRHLKLILLNLLSIAARDETQYCACKFACNIDPLRGGFRVQS
jgi:hypothetical protein